MAEIEDDGSLDLQMIVVQPPAHVSEPMQIARMQVAATLAAGCMGSQDARATRTPINPAATVVRLYTEILNALEKR